MKLIIFTFILSFVLSTKAVILDTDGNELKPNTEYYILPSATVYAGGLTLGNKNSSCAENVAEDNSPTENGLPVNFTTINPNSTSIALNESINIAFSGPTTCNSSTVWTLVSDTDTGKRFVKIGGVLGNPGNDTLANWFNIQEYMNGLYKLVYCPSYTVCETCKPECGYLGIVGDDDEGRWLAITDEPFACAFTKA